MNDDRNHQDSGLLCSGNSLNNISWTSLGLSLQAKNTEKPIQMRLPVSHTTNAFISAHASSTICFGASLKLKNTSKISGALQRNHGLQVKSLHTTCNIIA